MQNPYKHSYLKAIKKPLHPLCLCHEGKHTENDYYLRLLNMSVSDAYQVQGYRSRIEHTRRVVAAGLLVALLLTPKLWFSERVYPLIPVDERLVPIPFPYDMLIYLALILLSAALCFRSFPRLAIVILPALLIVYSLWDQQRWVPFFYQMVFMLLTLAVYYLKKPNSAHPELTLYTIGVIISGTYLWSGIQKLNFQFVLGVGPWMLESIFGDITNQFELAVILFSALAPFAEIFLAIGLWIRRYRKLAILTGIAMHLFILMAVGPLGANYNSQVWFWNIASAVLLVVVFWGTGFRLLDIFPHKIFSIHTLVVLLFLIAPLGSYSGHWDDYPSMTLYSGSANNGIIYLTDEAKELLPDHFRSAIHTTKAKILEIVEQESFWQDRFPYYMRMGDFAYADINVPDYHAERVFVKVGESLCRLLGNSEGLGITIAGRAHWRTGKRDWKGYKCEDDKIVESANSRPVDSGN